MWKEEFESKEIENLKTGGFHWFSHGDRLQVIIYSVKLNSIHIVYDGI